LNNNNPKKKEVNTDMNRRGFLNTTRNMGIAVLGGLVWSAHVDKAKASRLLLRPPGALKEEEFLKTCIKCGLCVSACANRDTKPRDVGGTLRLATTGDEEPLGTPFFIANEVPCYMCEDIPCVPVCPTGALDIKSLLLDKKEEKSKLNNGLDINKARMGLAVVDMNSCIAYWGIQCDACYRACPLLDEAITLEYSQNKRTGKHAFLKPIVHGDKCTGCGLCELACVTEKPAIFVLPIENATGRAGAHYIKGWDKKDEARLENAKEIKTTTNLSKRNALDNLNDMGGLLDD
jgi:ferredoxin-type protein NapG